MFSETVFTLELFPIFLIDSIFLIVPELRVASQLQTEELRGYFETNIAGSQDPDTFSLYPPRYSHVYMLGVGGNSTSRSSFSVTNYQHVTVYYCNALINMQWDLSSEVLDMVVGIT